VTTKIAILKRINCFKYNPFILKEDNFNPLLNNTAFFAKSNLKSNEYLYKIWTNTYLSPLFFKYLCITKSDKVMLFSFFVMVNMLVI